MTRRLVVDLNDPRPLWAIPAWAVEEVRRAAPPGMEVVVVSAPADGRGDGGAPSPEAVEAIGGAEIYLGFGFPRDLFAAARRAGDHLRWVHSGAAGVGGAVYPEMIDSPVALTNSAGIHAEPMGDTVLAYIHFFARGLDYAVRGQRERRWDREPFDGRDTAVRELSGATVGIVGYGGIGHAIGARAAALGMRVLATRRRAIPAPPGIELLTGPAALETLLRSSDYVVLAAPRTPATENLLDRERIAQLGPRAVVINIGRGELVDEEALVEALAANRIRGAALDVFRTEPLPPDSPFWSLPNVLVTPHSSGTTDRFWRREIDLVLENLHRYERGEPLLNLVDKQAGY